MDKLELGKEAAADLARESLIAISYTAPEKEAAADLARESLVAISYTEPEKEAAGKNSNGKVTGVDVVAAMKVDQDEKYRSKLISISYSQSPDTETLPVLPGGSIA